MGALKAIVVFALGLMFNLGFGQKEEVIEWQSGKKLTWADFKGKPSHISNAAAITASGITYSFSAQGTAEKMELDFTVSCHFYPNKSWYKSKLANSTVLNHEQLHFDITEVYARKLRQELAKAKFDKNAKSQVKGIYRNVLKELSAFQNKYDTETNYSRDSVQQLIWNKRIKRALNN